MNARIAQLNMSKFSFYNYRNSFYYIKINIFLIKLKYIDRKKKFLIHSKIFQFSLTNLQVNRFNKIFPKKVSIKFLSLITFIQFFYYSMHFLSSNVVSFSST